MSRPRICRYVGHNDAHPARPSGELDLHRFEVLLVSARAAVRGRSWPQGAGWLIASAEAIAAAGSAVPHGCCAAAGQPPAGGGEHAVAGRLRSIRRWTLSPVSPLKHGCLPRTRRGRVDVC